MTPADILRAAADLIERPGGWAQGVFARKASGVRCSPWDREAACFCAEGAIMRAVRSPPILDEAARADAKMDAEIALRRMLRASIPNFNDAPTTTAAIMAAKMRECAAGLEGEGGGK